MNCITVDDNKLASQAIKQLITQTDFLNLQHEFSNALDAFNFFKTQTTDLIFLDVEMPEMSGLEFLKLLPSSPIVILTTANPNYAVEAFDLNVADFIVKPLNLPRFLLAINKAKDIYDNKNSQIHTTEKDFMFIKVNSVLTKIQFSNIDYIQALGDYVCIYTNDKRHTLHLSLKNIEEKLPTTLFYRLHRSYIINITKIDSVEKETAYIGKHPIPIGEAYKTNLLKQLNLI